MRKNVVSEMGGSFGHTPRIAGRADTTPLAREGDEKVMTAVVATGARETVGKNAALEVFTEGLFDVSWWRVMVALAIKLACAGQFKPCLEMTGDGFIEQSLFGMAGAVQGAMQAGTLMPMRI